MKMIFLLFVFTLISCASKDTFEFTGDLELSEKHKICVFGDSGKNNSGQKKVAQALKKEGCSYFVHTGDIIYSRGIENASDPKLQSHFSQYYDFINKPFFLTVGNHDYKKNPLAWIDIAKKSNHLIFPHNYYFYKIQDLCMIALDTNADLFKQYIWLRKIKDKNKKQCKFTLAFGHHPLYSSGHHGDAHILNQVFLRSTIHSTVDLYVSGHDHNLSDEGEIDGTHYIVSGAAAVTRPLQEKIRHKAYKDLGYLVLTYDTKNNLMNYHFKRITSKGEVHTQRNSIKGKGFR